MSHLQGDSVVTEQVSKAQSDKDNHIQTLKQVIIERISEGDVTIANLADGISGYNEIDVLAALWYLLDGNEVTVNNGALSTPPGYIASQQ